MNRAARTATRPGTLPLTPARRALGPGFSAFRALVCNDSVTNSVRRGNTVRAKGYHRRRKPHGRRSDVHTRCLHAALRSGRRLALRERHLRGIAAHHAVRHARRPALEGPLGGARVAARRDSRRDHRLLDAGGPDDRRRDRGRRVRPVPDHVDRLQRDLDLQHDRSHRVLRGAPALVRADLGRRAHPGHHHRVLVRRAARGPRRLRDAGRHHGVDAHGPRLQADEGRRRRTRVEHRPGGLRGDRDPDHHARRHHRPPEGRPRRDGRPPDAVPRPDRPADPRRHGRRHARHPPVLAGRDGRRPGLRHRAVRLLELPLGRAHRHRRVAAVGRRARRLPARLGAGRVSSWRFGRPGDPLRAEPRFAEPAMAGGAAADPTFEAEVRRREGGDGHVDSRRDKLIAYAPYAIIIAIFAIAQWNPLKTWMADSATSKFDWPGLDILNAKGEAPTAVTYVFNWLPAAGTLLLIAGLISMLVLRMSPGRAVKIYGETLNQLKWATLTVMTVLGLAYVMNSSGQTTTIGQWIAGAGDVLPFLSPIIGWLGVAAARSGHTSQ